MKTVTFSAKSTDNKHTVDGTLVMSKTKNSLVFDSELNIFEDIKLTTEETITDVFNFIASYFRRVDKKGLFKKVKVVTPSGSKNVEILREPIVKKEQKTVKMLILSTDPFNPIMVPDQQLILSTSKEGEVVKQLSDISFQMIEVPENFEYTKDKNLNKILEFNCVKYDYDRQINQKINKAISKYKVLFNKESDLQYLFLDKYGKRVDKYNKSVSFIIQKKYLK